MNKYTYAYCWFNGKIEVKDMGYRTCMIITAGNRGGNMIATAIYLTPKQRQQLIKALQHPIPHQPKQQHGQDH